jgi:predicted RNA-binding protein YlxR (DUF448 family)
MRTCVACQVKRPKRELVRIVRAEGGVLDIDPGGKRPGRGAYLCSNRKCWDMSEAPRRLARALKCQVRAENIERLRHFAESLPLEVGLAGSEGRHDNGTKR